MLIAVINVTESLSFVDVVVVVVKTSKYVRKIILTNPVDRIQYKYGANIKEVT
jgi:hypothetical protein